MRSLVIFAMLPLLFSCGGAKKQETAAAHPEWSYDATIYEVNTRQFSPEGTFVAVEEQLPRLKDLGVDVLWFMPVQPIGEKNRKGELGSYYSISDYTGINPEFGTKEDFKRLVDKAHSMGMKVILDWVANHTAWDSDWVVNEDWYVRDSAGNMVAPYDWTDVAELNYDNPQMRDKMTESMKYWIDSLGVDGFRADMAMELPIDYWEDAVRKLKSVNHDIFMLAEAEDAVVHRNAFDASYAWELHHLMNKIAKGEVGANALREYVTNDLVKYPVTAYRMIFTSNHDENSWNGSEFERMGDAASEFAVLSYVLPGIPLIYNGQEVGFDKRLRFFAKDTIEWTDRGGYTEFYKSLNKFRKNNSALHSGDRGGEFKNIPNDVSNKVFSFSRSAKDGNIVVGLFNLTPNPVKVKLEKDVVEGTYNELFENNTTVLSNQMEYSLPGWGYRVFYKR